MTDALASLPWRLRGRLPTVDAGEKLLRRSRGHWVRRVPPVLVALLLSAASWLLLSAAASLSADPQLALGFLIAGLVLSLAVLHWFFHFLLSENLSGVWLTNKRILLFARRLWLLDNVEEIILHRIAVVDVRRHGVLQQLLDYGHLHFDPGDKEGISFVPHPKAWAEDIERQVR